MGRLYRLPEIEAENRRMKLVFGLGGLLVVLAIVMLLGRQQVDAVNKPLESGPVAASGATTAEKARNAQDQVRDQMNSLMQQRPAQLDEAR